MKNKCSKSKVSLRMHYLPSALVLNGKKTLLTPNYNVHIKNLVSFNNENILLVNTFHNSVFSKCLTFFL